jgi:hypothetical protein
LANPGFHLRSARTIVTFFAVKEGKRPRVWD